MSSPSHDLHGSSPPQSSFSFEYMNFMQSFVAPRRRRQGSGPPAPTQYHLTALPQSKSTRQHPLCGMWKGIYGPHGLEVVTVRYNTEGSSARIEATKVLGDPNVPATKVTWRAEAAPMPAPLDTWEEQLVGNLVFPHPGQQEHLRASGQLLAVHRGEAQVAGDGYDSPTWVEGRLWVYSSGDIEFAWLRPFMFVVRFTRLQLPGFSED